MSELTTYRVWADGTVQEAEDTPHSHMSDDYITLRAPDEEAAELVGNPGQGTVPSTQLMGYAISIWPNTAWYQNDTYVNTLLFARLVERAVRETCRRTCNLTGAGKLNRDQTVAVSTEVFFNTDMSKAPRGVKLQLDTKGGCARYGTYDGKDPFIVGWCLVPGRRPT